MSSQRPHRSPQRSHSPDSLFSEPDEISPATRGVPPIPGLYVFPALLPGKVAQVTLEALAEHDTFHGGIRDQVMLFSPPPPGASSLPSYLLDLVKTQEELLRPVLPDDALSTCLEQPLARQVILNLYPPGQGISPHIDLPNRYADGILGVSLIGGCTMTFRHDSSGTTYEVYLPSRTVYVLTGEARWEWTHGIAGRREDLVESTDGDEVVTLLRDTRVSVTFRWMQEGGDVLS